MASTIISVMIWILIFLLAVKLQLNANEMLSVTASETAILICSKSTDINTVFWTGPPGLTTYSYPGSTEIEETLANANRLEINGTNAALLIHNTTLGDQGLYRCSAGALMTADTELIVTNNVPRVVSGYTQFLVDLNTELQVEVKVYSNIDFLDVSFERSSPNDSPTASWSFTKTSTYVDVPIYNKHVRTHGYRISLSIELLSDADYGNYSIVIQNSLGPARHNVQFLPKERPAVPSSMESDNNFTGKVVGGVVAGVGVVACAIAVAVFIRYRRNKKEPKPTQNEKSGHNESNKDGSQEPSVTNNYHSFTQNNVYVSDGANVHLGSGQQKLSLKRQQSIEEI